MNLDTEFWQNMDKHDRPPIWEAVCNALGTEYKEATQIKGSSGMVHPLQAIGVDDEGKRALLISADHNPRIAALMRHDVQSAMPGIRILVARPLAIDLAEVSRRLFFAKNGVLNVVKLRQFGEAFQSEDVSNGQLIELLGTTAEDLVRAIKLSSLPVRSHIFNLIEQLSDLNWQGLSLSEGNALAQISADVLTRFSKIDSLAGDRERGICPIPTYEMTEDDWDLFHANKDLEEIQSRLRELDIYQYFYPPQDRLTLGLIDRGVGSVPALSNCMDLAKQQGHELSSNTIVPNSKDLLEILQNLKTEGYVMEGEFQEELTDEGVKYRKLVKVRPSEGLVAQLSRLMSVNVDFNLRDLFGSNKEK